MIILCDLIFFKEEMEALRCVLGIALSDFVTEFQMSVSKRSIGLPMIIPRIEYELLH